MITSITRSYDGIEVLLHEEGFLPREVEKAKNSFLMLFGVPGGWPHTY